MEKFVLQAQPRSERGSRRMDKIRASGRIPAVIYGHKQENRPITFDTKEIAGFIHAGHRFLTVSIAGVEEYGMLKEVQYDSYGSQVIHVDIARIDIHEKITTPVRIETTGIPKGISQGGNFDLSRHEVLVEGSASAIPEKIVVPVAALELGHVLRIKDLPPIPGCRYMDDPEGAVASVLLKKIEEAPVAGAPVPEMPEVIAKKQDEDEAEAEPPARLEKAEKEKPEKK